MKRDVSGPGQGPSSVYNSLIVDLLSKLLNKLSDTGTVSNRLTAEVRELTGARTVALVQYLPASNFRVVSVNPERRRNTTEAAAMGELLSLVRQETEIRACDPSASQGRIEQALASLGLGLSLVVPLNVEKLSVGTLLLFDLPELKNIEIVVEALRVLSTVVALVFRNSLLYEEQEAMVEERTQMLRESENRFRVLVEQAADAFFLTDRDGRIEDVNLYACKLLDFPREELLALRLSDIEVASAKGCKLVSAGEEDISSKLARTVEAEYRRKGGQTLPVEVRSNKVELGGNMFSLLLVRDVSERRQMEEERLKMERRLQQAQKMEAIGTLASGIAHDFNNVLQIIAGYTELASLEDSDEAARKNKLERVIEAVQRGKDLATEILTFSREDEQKHKPLDMRRAVREAVRLLRASIPSSVEISQKATPGEAIVSANATQIYQVLLNLCTNANHAMAKEGGVLTIETGRIVLEQDDLVNYPELTPGKYFSLTVSDTGCGMDPDVLERIFDPYFSTKPQGEGTGLGLSVVHGIVGNHGGAIRVYSEKGKGSTFNILLPLVQENFLLTQNRPEIWRSQKHLRVLFVDDEPAIAEAGKQMLEYLGCQVVTTTSSKEAFELFRSQPDAFDLVITDMTMPHMTGADLSMNLLRVRPGIPVILTTGFNERISRETARSMGIHKILMKPVLVRDLASAIRDATNESPTPG